MQPTPTPSLTTQSPNETAIMEDYSYEYNMQHKHRGYALIFNNEIFAGPGLKDRHGTAKDGIDLIETLSFLDFTVKHFKDFKWWEIEREIEKYAREDHSDNDCILVAIMSHGELGTIWAKDRKYTLDSIWGPFVDCPSLAGKPKLFFIQACQGNKVDHGITLKSVSQTDGSGPAIASGSVMSLDEIDDATDGGPTGGSVTGYAIPNSHSDILIAYSTVPGFYSWRNSSLGSWFMQSLCTELKTNGKADGYDLLTLLTFVIQRVALDYESNCNGPRTSHLHKKRQTPCVTHLLTRLLYFRDNSAHYH